MLVCVIEFEFPAFKSLALDSLSFLLKAGNLKLCYFVSSNEKVHINEQQKGRENYVPYH